MNELEQLEERLMDVIHNTCNTIGCDNCHLKWANGCSATELQIQVMELEMKEDEVAA